MGRRRVSGSRRPRGERRGAAARTLHPRRQADDLAALSKSVQVDRVLQEDRPHGRQHRLRSRTCASRGGGRRTRQTSGPAARCCRTRRTAVGCRPSQPSSRTPSSSVTRSAGGPTLRGAVSVCAEGEAGELGRPGRERHALLLAPLGLGALDRRLGFRASVRCKGVCESSMTGSGTADERGRNKSAAQEEASMVVMRGRRESGSESRGEASRTHAPA